MRRAPAKTHQTEPTSLAMAVFGILLGATAVAGALCTGVTTRADVIDTFTAEVTAACTLSGQDHTYAGTLQPGLSTDFGPTTIQAICNDANGYALYAVGYSGDSYTTNNTKLIGSYDSINTSAPGDAGDGSYWAMKVEAVSGAYAPTIANNFGDFRAVPSSFTKIASYAHNTDGGDGATGSSVNAYYTVHASATQTADTYQGKVKYVLVHPGTMVAGTYSITYDANGGTGSMASQTDLANYQAQTLTASTLTAPAGYQFAGWCTDKDTSQNPQTTCGGVSYSDASVVEPSTVTAGGTLSLHAYWRPLTLADYEYMQDIAGLSPAELSVVVSSTPEEATYQLKDSRDQQSYSVSKLKDGKVWMTTNLNLAGGTALSSSTTDFDSAYSLPTDQGWGSGGTLPASSTGGFDSDNYAYVYNSGTTTNCGASGQNLPCYSYYSWDAATLGSGRSISSENTDAAYSICPKGWRLPTSGSPSNGGWKRGDFYALATAYGANLESNHYESSSVFYDNAGPGTTANFLLAGLYSGPNAFIYGGSYGCYWSSTSYSDESSVRYMFFDDRRIYAADDSNRRYGYPVRCLFSAN